jgi:hypothetical protein
MVETGNEMELDQDRQVVGLSKISWYVRHYQMLKDVATNTLLRPCLKLNSCMRVPVSEFNTLS